MPTNEKTYSTVKLPRETLYGKLLPHIGKVTSLIGGGGKTTTMLTLAEYLSARGRRVLVTTSTHIGVDTLSAIPNGVDIVATPINDHKCTGLEFSLYEDALKKYDHILVEADGSRCLPLKWHRQENEPVIPPYTDLLIILSGLSALGKTAKETLHRQELSDIPENALISPEIIARLTQRAAAVANVTCKCIAIYNQVDLLPADAPLPQPGFEGYATSMKGFEL